MLCAPLPTAVSRPFVRAKSTASTRHSHPRTRRSEGSRLDIACSIPAAEKTKAEISLIMTQIIGVDELACYNRVNYKQSEKEDIMELNPKTKVNDLITRYPFLKDFLISLNPEFKMLDNPFMRKTVGRIASLNKVAMIGGIDV